MQNDNNNLDMKIYSMLTVNSDRTNLTAPVFDMNSKVLVQSNVVASAASVSLPSVLVAVSETGDNHSEKRQSGLYNVSSK